VTGLDTQSGRVDCDLIAVAAIPSPASEGPRQHGCKVALDPDAGGFRVIVDEHGKTSTAGVWAAGDVTGYMGPQRATADGARVGANVAASLE
jgi:thioredoxin reductase